MDDNENGRWDDLRRWVNAVIPVTEQLELFNDQARMRTADPEPPDGGHPEAES